MSSITKNIFIASSMAHPMREGIANIIAEINKVFRDMSIDFKYQVYIFPDGPTENAGDANTQSTIDNEISTSDIFILLVEDGTQLGSISYQELMHAHDTETQSAKSIVCYVIRKDGSIVNQTTCDMGNNEQCTIDEAMRKCGNRYARYVEESSFKDHLCDFLKSIVIGARYKQSELNYTNYIHTKPNQIFRTEPLYFRRDIDEEITNVINNSSLIVLEGQSYCGKTRAAFNLMINNEQWANHHFYIIQGDHADALERIKHINTLTNDPTVVLIDDINMVFGSNDLQPNATNSFTSKLKILKKAPKWENLIVIITVSGKIDATETHNLYSKLFDATHYPQLLNDIRVNFNTNLTKQEFNKLKSKLRQEGLITDRNSYPGNYTIGSLFINERELEDKIANASKDGGDVFLHSLKTFSLVKKSIKGDDDLKILRSIFNITHERLPRPDSQKNIFHFIKKSQSDGLIFVEYSPDNNISAINFDNLVLDKLNFIPNRINAIKDLIDSANQNIILQYGFWVLSYNDLAKDETEQVITHICQKFNMTKHSVLALKQECQQLQHLDIFCATALAKEVFNDWWLLDKLPKTHNLYKDTLVALLHKNLKLSKIKEENVLNKIFINNKCIFTDEDLKSNIFALKQLSPHFIKKGIYTTSKILDLAEKAIIANCQSDACDDSDDPFEISDNRSSNGTNNDDGFLLIQIGKVIHELLKTTSDYNELKTIFDEINKFDDNSKIKQATQTSFFDKNLYYLLVDIAKKYPYPDKYELFKHILKEPESPSLNSHLKTLTLNNFLPLLDEHDALSAFYLMKEKKICDRYTLPYLINNDFLTFEQLLSIFNDDNKDLVHFITLNQLLDKAETRSDAISCFSLMGVTDLKPENLKDETALGSYLKIKDITAKESIEVLKAFKINNKYNEKNKCISQETLGKIIQKSDFKYDSLYNLLFGLNTDNELNLSDKEVIATRNNQYNYNFLYKKNQQLDKDTAKEIFNKIPKDLIYNDHNSSIIAEYTKNNQAFPDYNSLKNFYDNIENFKHTPYTYKSLLDCAINQPNSIDDKINLVNSLLIDAYNYFANKFPEDEVIEKMAYIYHMRLELVREDAFNNDIEYPYEGQIEKTTFKGYLYHIFKKEPRYANGTFIFRTLKSMETYNEDIYNLAHDLASINRVGITTDSLKSLHENIINKILNITDDDITIDSLIIADYSHIKMLWWLLENNKISFEQAEASREKYEIDVTQTYLNILFKKFSQMTNRHEPQKKLIERWETMNSHKNNHVNNKSIYFSIQMAVAMLKTAKKIHNDNYWDLTISYLSDEWNKNFPEILDLKISRLSQNLKNENVIDNWGKIIVLLRDHKDIVNTSNINSCLALLQFVKMSDKFNNDIKDNAQKITQNLWNDGINKCLKINLNILFNSSLNSSNKPPCDNNLCDNNLYVNADVRTFVYYTEKKETYQIIKEHFNNSLFYDKKKNCLKDFLKNLSRAINNELITLDGIKGDLENIISSANNSQLVMCAKDSGINDDIKEIIGREQANRTSQCITTSRG